MGRDAPRPRRTRGLARADPVRARARRGRLVHPAESGERSLLALQLLGPAVRRARRAERDLGLSRGRERRVLAHDSAVRREQVLSSRGQPLDRDAAGDGRDDHRRRLRVPSAAARRLPRGSELVGARTPVPDRVGLPAIPRVARAVPDVDPARVLPPQLLGRGRGQRARDRGDGRAHRRRSHVHLDGLPALRLQLPARLGESPEERPARDRRAHPGGRCAPLRLHRGRFQEGGRRGGGEGLRQPGRRPLVIAYLSRRLAWAVVLLFGITLAVFLVVHLSGDPTALYVGPEGTRQDYEMVRAALGFDRPLPEQYGRFLLRAVQGDFGRSLRHQQPTLPLVLTRFPATLKLALVAMALAVALALPLGILSALRRNSVLDTFAMAFALSGQCMPTFWLGILLILVFAVQLRWVPVYGGEGLAALALPALTLGVWAMARTARITRSSMLEVLHQDFLRTARAKGISEWGVILRHALRNGAIPIVTAIGLELGNLLGGAVITEAVFAYPGVGRLAVEAVVNKDVPLLQAVVFTVAASLILLNAAIDLLYMALDPRVRLA